MKCKSCGYHKNPLGASHCNLCGSPLEEEYGGGGDEVRFGQGMDLRKARVEEKRAFKPSDDQIVYAGDFAIVYVFTPLSGDPVILTPGEVFTFGRGDVVDYKLDSKIVSRRHARVHWVGTDPPVPEIVDLESKNGVTVNGVPVHRKTLEDGDEVEVGPSTFTLRVVSANDDLENQVQVDRLGATMVSTRRLSGEVRLVPLPFLLQHLERIKESGTLSVQSGESHGSVTFISGVVIAAEYGEQEGQEAIRSVARQRDGRFSFSPRADATPQSIGKTIGEVLQAEMAGRGPHPVRRRPPPPRRRPPARRPPPPRRSY